MASLWSTIARRTAGTVAGLAVGSAVAYGSQVMPLRESQSASSSVPDTSSESIKMDPYENLPATDEPTHCVICRTNRKGPCQTLWRKFERCMKDHPPKPQNTKPTQPTQNDLNDKEEEKEVEKEVEEEENFADTKHDDTPDDSEFCNKYMMDWIPCVRKHFLLYAMYSNQLDADYYDQMQSTLAPNDIHEWKADDIDVDWSDYLSMLQTLQMNIVQIYTADERAADPLWEKGSPDPPAVEVFVRINLIDDGDNNDNDNLPIALCYARDDVGTIIGVGHFNSPKDYAEDSDDNDTQPITTDSVMTMTFRPNKTRRITLYKVYEEVLGDNEAETNRPLKKKVYVSKKIDLLEVARAAGTFTPHFQWEGTAKQQSDNS